MLFLQTSQVAALPTDRVSLCVTVLGYCWGDCGGQYPAHKAETDCGDYSLSSL